MLSAALIKTSMNKGRPKAIIWEHFIEKTKDGKKYAECKICNNSMIGEAERMKTHRTRCLEKEGRQKTEAKKETDHHHQYRRMLQP